LRQHMAAEREQAKQHKSGEDEQRRKHANLLRGAPAAARRSGAQPLTRRGESAILPVTLC
ncbi:MAG: hypothetical protein ACRCYS_19445, partial [Beijerinckiaceae bacterium]